MYELYIRMSKAQQDAAKMTFYMVPPPVKYAPSSELYESWKDPRIFGVWLDGKKVSNEVLRRYQPSDIAESYTSRLTGAAKKGKSYKYQLDLTTNAEFDRTYKDRMRDRILYDFR